MAPRKTSATHYAQTPGISKSANEHIDDETKQLLAAILDFTSTQRHHEASERPSSLGIGQALKRHGLAARHTSALLTVALHGPMTVTQLAQRQRIKLKAASLTAVELEQAGLLERREDPADRRRTIVAIPKTKERAVNKGLLNRATHVRRTLDRLTPQQRDGLITGLNTLTEELTKGQS
jgi:DNA-binding MarR family transcriptional regulator